MRLLKYSGVAARIITGLLIITLAAHPVLFPALSQGTTPIAEADTGDETTYYFLTDHLGSVDAVLDEQGNVVERRDYLPYGSQRVAETFNGVPITELGFTGKHLDSETGLNYYGARYYDPVTGRFITMDPLLLNLDKMSQAQRNAFLSNPQNLNMYSYVQNNPVNYVDPTGEWGVAAGLGGKSHQYITSNAIENASLCLNAEDRDTLIYSASIWSDWLVYRFGEDKKNYNHSTSSGGSMTALEIKDAMMSDAKKWYTSGYLDEFGRLLHMVEDSYAPGHVERDSKGNITAFLDASKQTLSFHTKYDNYLDENDEVRPEALQAIGVATKLIDYYYNGESWDVVADYLDTKVLKGVNAETGVGSAGERFYNDKD